MLPLLKHRKTILKHTPGGQQHDQRQRVLKYGIEKRLSHRFGSKRHRRNQLVARLKGRRKYKPPVRGGRKRKKF